MTEELEQLLKNLKLRRILEIYDEQLRAADKDDISYSDFVTRLVRAQFQAQQEGALEWRIRRANLPERWTMETFPFARQPGVNRKQMRGFAELEFIAQAENIVLVGKTGVGKTGLACGLLLKALENGYRCPFVRAQDLFDEMYASLADRSTRQLLKRLARLDVLLIDELGYLNLKPEQSNIFFKLMEERYRQHSTIITTNLLCGAPHKRFNAESSFMRTPRSIEAACRYCVVFLLRILGAAFNISISLSVALNRPVRSFGAITDSRASSFTDGSARV
jgi:DNA replication protein DnaC